ncbi:MAG: hypothetical protein ACKV2V_02130, partial [Blastocatellia bacterium]
MRYLGNIAWTVIAGSDGGFSLIDQSNPATIYHSTQNYARSSTRNPDFGPYVAFNGGTNWQDRGCRNCTAAAGRMNPSDRVLFYSPMAGHTGFTGPTGNVIYRGTNRVYRSADNGVTWTGLGPSTDGYGQDLTNGTGNVSAIAANPILDRSTTPPGEIVWTGSGNAQVQVTKNAGALGAAVFTNVTKEPLPNRFVTDIATDPNNAMRAVVTYSGFNSVTPARPGHVFVTMDLGESWRDISGNLPDVPVTSAAIDPYDNNALYIGTDLGVFRTTNGGAIWERLDNGMPRIASFAVRYHAATRSLVVATHGRGMYRMALAAPAVNVSAASVRRNGLAVESIAAAFGQDFAAASASATSVPLPTELAGTRVRVRDVSGTERAAPLFFVSPGQINYQVPAGTLPGPVAITITSANGQVATSSETVADTAVAVFTANSSGTGAPAGYVVRVRGANLTYDPIWRVENGAIVPVDIEMGPEGDQVILVLACSGVRRRTNAADVRATVGGTSLAVDYAGETPGFIGLDQVNILLPRSLAGRGAADVVVNVRNVAGNAVGIRIK